LLAIGNERGRATDLAERSGHGGGQARPCGNGALNTLVAEGRRVDKIRVDQHGRAREHQFRDIRDVGRERDHDMARRIGRRGQALGHGAPDDRRRVVEHGGERRLRFPAVGLR
jgi:hypothetical protein